MWVNKAIVGMVLALGLPSATYAADGASVYKNNCETCHPSDGWGIPFMAAPLDESAIVDGDAAYLSWVGITGTCSIEGWEHDVSLPLPGRKSLNNDDPSVH